MNEIDLLKTSDIINKMKNKICVETTDGVYEVLLSTYLNKENAIIIRADRTNNRPLIEKQEQLI